MLHSLKKHVSKPFNPAIANVFFLAGYVESWGRGIEKITEELLNFNGVKPDFRYDGGLWVEFGFNKLDEKVGERLGDKLGEKLIPLNKNRQRIIIYIQENPTISIPQLAQYIGISTTAIENNIKYLKQHGILKRIGSAKGGQWEVVDEA